MKTPRAIELSSAERRERIYPWADRREDVAAFLKHRGESGLVALWIAALPLILVLVLQALHGGEAAEARRFTGYLLYLVWPFMCLGLYCYVEHAKARAVAAALEKQKATARSLGAATFLIEMLLWKSKQTVRLLRRGANK